MPFGSGRLVCLGNVSPKPFSPYLRGRNEGRNKPILVSSLFHQISLPLTQRHGEERGTILARTKENECTNERRKKEEEDGERRKK